MIPLWESGPRSTYSMGMPMCQNRLAVPIWSYAIEEMRPDRVIEIGSYNGALATALGLTCKAIGAKMITYDINRPSEAIVPIGEALGVVFQVASCWDRQAEIGALIGSPGPSMVLCDGGDKPRELDTFARYLKTGDVIAAHDYDAVHEVDSSVPQAERPWPFSEIVKAQGDEIAAMHNLEPWMQEHFDLAGWLVYRCGTHRWSNS